MYVVGIIFRRALCEHIDTDHEMLQLPPQKQKGRFARIGLCYFQILNLHLEARDQTSAPALGSVGSYFGFFSFTRSSRFTPSHMASAAATNTDE